MQVTLGVMVACTILFISACSSVQLQKDKAIILKIAAGAKTAVVTGCNNLPAVEVDIALIEKFIPPGSTTTSVEVAIATGETAANVICAKVAALQAAQTPVVVPVVPVVPASVK